jgi:hypothetical protein
LFMVEFKDSSIREISWKQQAIFLYQTR